MLNLLFSSSDIFVAVDGKTNIIMPVASLSFQFTLRAADLNPMFSRALYSEESPETLTYHSQQVVSFTFRLMVLFSTILCVETSNSAITPKLNNCVLLESCQNFTGN